MSKGGYEERTLWRKGSVEEGICGRRAQMLMEMDTRDEVKHLPKGR